MERSGNERVIDRSSGNNGTIWGWETTGWVGCAIWHEASAPFHSLHASSVSAEHTPIPRDRILFAYSFICPLIWQLQVSATLWLLCQEQSPRQVKNRPQLARELQHVQLCTRERWDMLLKKREKAFKGPEKNHFWREEGRRGRGEVRDSFLEEAAPELSSRREDCNRTRCAHSICRVEPELSPSLHTLPLLCRAHLPHHPRHRPTHKAPRDVCDTSLLQPETTGRPCAHLSCSPRNQPVFTRLPSTLMDHETPKGSLCLHLRVPRRHKTPSTAGPYGLRWTEYMNKRRGRCQLENLLRRFFKGEASRRRDSSEWSGGDKGEVERRLRRVDGPRMVGGTRRRGSGQVPWEVETRAANEHMSAEVQGVPNTASQNCKTISLPKHHVLNTKAVMWQTSTLYDRIKLQLIIAYYIYLQ